MRHLNLISYVFLVVGYIATGVAIRKATAYDLDAGGVMMGERVASLQEFVLDYGFLAPVVEAVLGIIVFILLCSLEKASFKYRRWLPFMMSLCWVSIVVQLFVTCMSFTGTPHALR